MPRPEITRRMDALSAPVRLLLAEFLADKLETRQKEFMRIPETDFKTQKGRCFELEELIRYFEGSKQ